MLQKGDIKLGEDDAKLRAGNVMPPKENVGPPKAKWYPLIVKECEMRCLLTPRYVNHLRNQTIHQTLTKKMVSKDRG
jgi:hypothetical protein